MKKRILQLLLALALASGGVARAEGPFGGSISGLAFGPDRTPAYAATSRGLFHMEGGKWKRLEALGTSNLTAFAAVPGALLAAVRNKALLRSEDEGRTWTPVSAGLRSRFGAPVDEILSMAYDPTLKTVYLGSGGKGIFSSKDGGITWTLMSAGMDRFGPAAQHVVDIVAGKDKRPLLIGTDGEGLLAFKEDKWTPACKGLPDKAKISSLGTDPADPMHLAVGTTFEGLWESLDGGETCRQVYKGQFGVASAAAIGEGGTIAGYLAQEGLYIHRAEGRAKPVNLGFTVVRSISGTKDGGFLLATLNDGFLTAGKTGVLTGENNVGLDAVTIKSIMEDEADGSLWVGDLNGVYHSVDSGRTWTRRDKGLITGEGSAFVKIGKDIFVGTGGQGVFRWSAEKGEWEFRGRELGTANTIFSMVKTPEGRIYVGTEGGVLWSDDGGGSWKPAGQGIPLTSRTCVAVDPANAKRLLAANGKGVYESLDAGASWTSIATGPYLTVRVEGKEVWATTPRTLVRLVGEKAETIFDEGSHMVYSFIYAKEGIWVGTDEGLWSIIGTEKALQWDEAGVTSIFERGSQLVVGTDGRGVKTFKIE